MKNRNLILSVLLWAICSTVFAVTLPTSSYSFAESYTTTDAVSFTLGSGISILGNAATIDDARAGSCYVDKQDPNAIQKCEDCCLGSAYIPCIENGGSDEECGQANLDCYNACLGRSLPLGSPLLLLPFALVYAVIRRKHKVTE
ncbi:MAG: hypothetical protein IKB64_08695 [Paludibacteraceae bacterium]|nr:hypothetical protein [Paludibacteraceae bacterium]MBR6686737.1 hypothetical protein [Paludibacteraceae bacterium]